MRTVRGTLVLAILGVALVVVSVPSAEAHDHRVPQVILMTGEGRDHGVHYYGEWATGEDDYCTVGIGEGPRTFPEEGVGFEAGDPVQIRIFKRRRPAHIELWYFRRVDQAGFARGDPTELPFRLQRHLVDGRVAGWDIVFRPEGSRHYYIDFFGTWQDEEGCDYAQHGAWAFHAEELRPQRPASPRV